MSTNAEKVAAITSHLEAIEKARINAFNTRDFGPQSVFYNNVHPDLRVADPRDQGNGVMPLVSQEGLVEGLAQICEMWPELQVQLLEMKTVVEDDEKYATMWTTSTYTGDFLTSRSRLQVTRFECVGGEWLIVGCEDMYGGDLT